MFDKDVLQELYRYAYSLACDEHDAYDLLQCALESFLKSGTVANQSTHYMKAIIKNRYIDEYRRKKIVHFENLEDAILPADFDVQTLEDLLINENMAQQILQSLDLNEREIMYCWAIEGFSTAEIAEKLKKPKGTILSKIYRMRQKIVAQFGQNFRDVTEVEL